MMPPHGTAPAAASAFAPGGEVIVEPAGSGPLDGVRVVVKDLYDVAGTVTGAGNPALAAGPPAARHAAAVATLLAAGARVVGKTATDELAMGMFGVNAHYGTPLNPSAPDRVPGGSSSGSASAVAAGLASLGLGTDTGGSIRVPASFCGLYGLRPTHGRIDASGVRPMAPGFDTVGLLAADPALIETALGVLTGGVPASGVRTGRACQRREVSGLVLLTDLLDVATDEVAGRTRRTAAGWAAALGLRLREARLAGEGTGPFGDLVSVFWLLMSRQLWLSNGEWARRERPPLGAGIEERILAAGTVTDEAAAAAERTRGALRRRLAEVLGDGVAVLPTTMDAAPPRASTHEDLMAYRDRNLRLIVPASLCGSPQLTVPAGTVMGAAGTAAPVGVSLLGLPADDELLLALARDLARAAGEPS